MNMLTIDIHASTNNLTLILLSANTLSQCEADLKTISHIRYFWYPAERASGHHRWRKNSTAPFTSHDERHWA